MKEKGFDIIISSDLQYEELCAEIYFDGNFVGMITQEKGIENSVIEIYPPRVLPKWTFNYTEFVEFLQYAQNRLKQMKKKS
jgi:phage pi2 protein 07